LGYDGKSCIHPVQVPTIHEVYASTDDERDWAERVLSAWAEGNGAERGIVSMDGEMIEALHVTLAERILQR
jgi:citrate lyase beta subunit